MGEHEEHSGEGSHGSGGHGGGHVGGHGGGGHAEGEHEGAPEWLISFADNVALMMGFFVILLAMNMTKKTAGGIGGEDAMGGTPSQAMIEFVIAIREAFHSPFNPNDEKEKFFIEYIKKKRGEGEQDYAPGEYNKLQGLQSGNYHRAAATFTFDDRSAILSSATRQNVGQVAEEIADQRWVIEIRGHVSPLEVMRNEPRARELSYQRAMAVASVLAEFGVRWDHMRVVAMGATKRLVARAGDAEEDRTNQRVEVVVTTEAIDPDPYSKPPSGAGDSHAPASSERAHEPASDGGH